MNDNTNCCGNCKYHEFDDHVDDWYCANKEAKDFNSYTRYQDVCIQYEVKHE